MVRQPDLAHVFTHGGFVAESRPAVSILQSLCAGLALVAVNVTLFVWLVGAA